MNIKSRNDYGVLCKWENFFTTRLLPRFGLDVAEICTDYQRNHDEGTDAIIRNFCGKRFARVDVKANRMFDYKHLFFALEHKCKGSDSWLENERALELNVVILHPWKDYNRDGYYKLVAYPISKLKELLDIKRLGNVPCTAKDTGTQFYRVSMEELENIKIWDSGWKWLGREETTWKTLTK